MTDYDLFLETKKKKHVYSGFDVKLETEHLFPFQKWVVERALHAGKYGVFSGTGTGKSRMQLVWSEQVALVTGKPTLLLAPLGVGMQTSLEAEIINVNLHQIEINNYEQLENVDASIYGGIGSEGFQSVEMDRKAIMFELKESYFDLMKKNMAEALRLKGLSTIFDNK